MQNLVSISQKFNKTRIAPTPSGYLHLGNVLSFAVTAALGQQTGANILLRIDDLDRTRANPQFIQDIFDTLNFLEITWDEGPRSVEEFEDVWSQVHRLDMYNQALQQLWDSGQVFACTCSRAQIDAAGTGGVYPGTCRNKHLPPNTPNAAWRLDTSLQKNLTIKTLAGEMLETALPDDMHHFIVRKKDGYPAYQLASVIDDLHFGVDLVVRGHDLWPSTLAQHYLASVLGTSPFENITFHHHPLLVQPNGNKLSKSAGATSVKFLRDEGRSTGYIYTQIAKMMNVNKQAQSFNELITIINEA
ncbi:MAG: tRNA glutamyl-Q synthetase [Sphingobacteriaceae bacterium]|nr:MAG: tRNA glutamyl-Q synthetase [Sphingobacteriaceae bacterium]